MNIPIGNLTITSFCSQNANHIKFRHDLSQDEDIYDFVSVDIKKDLHEVVNDEELELENSYIIQDKDKLVGYIYIEGISKTEGIVELRYAVHPEYRRLGYIGYSDSNRKGYGEQILEECSHYLFTFNDIKSVELHIRKDNIASIGCAEKAKYKRIGENNDFYYYIYRTYRKKDTYEH